MKAEIISVGTELLMGEVVNTDSAFIARGLSKVGIDCFYHSVVGDNPKRLEDLIETALKRSDIIIFTGGLGPTDDDLTKETVAKCFSKKLVLNEDELKKIKGYFDSTNREMPQNNIKQAYLPENSIVVENKNGTAPGSIMENDNKIGIILPGPPAELFPMFEDTVMPYLEDKSGERIFSENICLKNIGESHAVTIIDDLIKNQKNVLIAPYVGNSYTRIRVSVKGKDEKSAYAELNPVTNEIKKRLKDYIMPCDGENLAEYIVKTLSERGQKLSVAESCTGGLLGSIITSVSGASEVFDGGFITYSNEIKNKVLGVSKKTLELFGAVSEECAIEMALGARKNANSNYALSITGIAGPTGGTKTKCVGTVCIGLSDGKKAYAKTFVFKGNRESVRKKSTQRALLMLLEELS